MAHLALPQAVPLFVCCVTVYRLPSVNGPLALVRTAASVSERYPWTGLEASVAGSRFRPGAASASNNGFLTIVPP